MFEIKSTLLNRGRTGMWLLLVGFAISVTGCDTENDLNTSSTVTLPDMVSPASLTTTSADDYNDNIYGLITGATLATWIADWPNNKPYGLASDSKLIILQASAGEAGSEYITSDPANGVFTYLAPMVNELRSNGVVQTKSMVPSGEVIDAFLSKYNIDPSKDMVVCAQGTAGGYASMQAGRCWYTLRYWGMLKGQVAVLNGGNAWNETNNGLVADVTVNTAPETGTASVKDLPALNFALQATLEDMVNITPTTDTNELDDGVFIWDARGSNQYYPTGDGDFQSGPVQGHPNGALNLNYSNLLDSANGYTYKTKAELQAYIDGDVDAGSNGFLDITLQAVGNGNAYQSGDTVYTYCETTYRAMVTGFASAAILGLPTRFYDGAMTEWHSLSAVADSDGNLLAPANSPWRTDTLDRSHFFQKSVAVNAPTSGSSGYIVDAYSNTAQNIIIEDLAYKGIVVETGSTGDTSSGGGVLPANPCGG
ncbi:MAG: sulfurtransferase [Gammaproteobacteria bacterium]|nr:sulfurtransferase [Gammaproteobacteria bacterium]MCW9056329.1 sulfurtransferase [Gammaproteobacteria bacterium]